MTMHIHSVTDIDPSDLRNLVVEQLGELLGEGARLVEPALPVDGCCLATSDRHEAPVLISFDAHDPQRALLTGLARMDQLGSETAALFLQGGRSPAGLLVLAPAAPPGETLFGDSCPVSWRRIQVLSVNGELGMMIQPAETETAVAAPIPLVTRPAIVEQEFSPEEEQHFSHL